MAALALALLFGVGRLATHAAFALGYPYGLDYGEGTVWQQMRGIVAGVGYAPLRLLPGFVYEYPPLYHGIVAATAASFGLDELFAGRLVSLVATAACSLLVGLLTGAMLGAAVEHRVRVAAAVIAALVFATLPVVLTWSVLMRVDTLACAFTLAGMLLASRGLVKPAAAVWAGLAFAAALYTRQTCLPAPAAAFAVLLLARPRAAWLMLASAVASGLIALAVLSIATHGQFLIHILVYNINRIVWAHAAKLALVLLAGAITLAIGGIGLAEALRRIDVRDWRTIRSRLAGDVALTTAAIVVLMLVLKTLMLPAILKSGASDNYLIDWFAALAVLAGVAAVRPVRVAIGGSGSAPAAALLLFGIGLPVQMSAPRFFPDTAAHDAAAMARIAARIAASGKPVVSDDMVLVMRGGQSVVWEPAIIAELGAAGWYDERALAQRVRRGDFGFFVTSGKRGSLLFDERFNPVIADAMAARYPHVEQVGGLTLHLPERRRTLPGVNGCNRRKGDCRQ
jgi:hypothetical protein